MTWTCCCLSPLLLVFSAYPVQVLALRLDALRWNEAASKGLAEVMPHPQVRD